ncbi:MAG: YggT family protein [Acidimicrobiales bacterium]
MRFVQDLLTLYILIIVVQSLLSWFPTDNRSGGMATTKLVLARLTEPVLRPLRQIVPGVRSGIDFSPFVAVIILYIIKASI